MDTHRPVRGNPFAAILVLLITSMAFGCYRSHERGDSAPDATLDGDVADAQVDAPFDARLDASDSASPRSPHPCVESALPVVDLPANLGLGRTRVVSVGDAYGVSFSDLEETRGAVILTHDGRRILLDERRVEIVGWERGFLLIDSYGDRVRRFSIEGEQLGEPLVLPHLIRPNQPFEVVGGELIVNGHLRTGNDPLTTLIDVEAWTFRRLQPFEWFTWASSERALALNRDFEGMSATLTGFSRSGSGGYAPLFEQEAFLGVDAIQYDSYQSNWIVSGNDEIAGGYGPRFLRLSESGEILEDQVTPTDYPNGVHTAIAAGAGTSAMATRPVYAGVDSQDRLHVRISSGVDYGYIGSPSSFRPAIAWSSADSAFAVVTTFLRDSGEGYLGLRCGLR